MGSNRTCAAMAEVMLPSGVLEQIACGGRRWWHGLWHGNREVRWRGRRVPPKFLDEADIRLASGWFQEVPNDGK